MQNVEEQSCLVNLSEDELMDTQGGESVFYWLAYGSGQAYYYLKIAASMDESIPIG